MAMDVEIGRKPWRASADTLTLTNSSSSPPIDMEVYASCGFVVTALNGGATTLTYYVATGQQSNSVGGALTADTFAPLYDSTNTAVTLTLTSGGAYKFDDNCFPFPFVQLRTNAGTVPITLCKKT